MSFRTLTVLAMCVFVVYVLAGMGFIQMLNAALARIILSVPVF